MSNAQRQRWYQITLRELALAILAFGFALAWIRELSFSQYVHYAISGYLDGKRSSNEYSSTMIGETNGVHFIVTAGSPEWWQDWCERNRLPEDDR